MTRIDILAQLRDRNPTSEIDGTVYGPGDPPYETLIEEWADTLEAQQAAAPTADPLGALSQAFFQLIPQQFHGPLAPVYADVRTLVLIGDQAGIYLARRYLAQLPLPPELEDYRQPILDLLPVVESPL